MRLFKVGDVLETDVSFRWGRAKVVKVESLDTETHVGQLVYLYYPDVDYYTNACFYGEIIPPPPKDEEEEKPNRRRR